MDNATLVKLIEKYLNGTATAVEEQQLMEWYETTDDPIPFTATLDKQTKSALKAEMLHEIKQGLSTSSARRSSIFGLKKTTWLTIAAAAAIAVFSIRLLNRPIDHQISLKTAYGEVKAITLPDHSEVLLNGNSSITYQKDSGREIWLAGEAFFNVSHQTDKQRFLVHLADTLTIEVVGTEFNVQNRPSGAVIALKSGQIILIKNDQRIPMQPNEVIQIGRYAADGFERTTNEDINDQLAWQHNRLFLENTTLAALLDQLANTYGIETHVTSANLKERKASGTIPIDSDSDVLLHHICTLYGLVIAETSNERQYVLTAPE